MYKDVWKRSLAAVLTLCLVVTLVQWPTTVKAEGTKTWHTYQYGGEGEASQVEVKTAAAVFTANQNADGGNEILERISFDVHTQEEASGAKATVSYYVNPAEGIPDAGQFVGSEEVYQLTEGTNSAEFNIDSVELEPGTVFSVIVTLEGEGVSFYADEGGGSGKTYVKAEDGAWKDMASEGKYLTIQAITYDVAQEEAGIIQHLRETFSKSGSDTGISTENGSEQPGTEVQNNTESSEQPGTEIPVNTESSEQPGTEIPVNTETVEQPGTEIPDNTETVEQPGTEIPDNTETVEQPGTEIPDNTETVEQPGTEIPDNTETVEQPGTVIPDNTETGGQPTTEQTDKKQTGSNGLPLRKSAKAAPRTGGQPAISMDTLTLGVGETRQLSINDGETDVVYTWASDNGEVASVDSSGLVTANAVGSAEISISDGEGTKLDTCTVTVKPNISETTVVIETAVYTGAALEPVIHVTAKDGQTELVKDTDYSVTYETQPMQNANTYNITITGANSYAGSRTETFTIEPESLTDIDRITVEMNDSALDGGDLGQIITVKDSSNGNMTLTKDTDYALSSSTDEETGRVTVTITGQGNYKDSVDVALPTSITNAELILASGQYIYKGTEWQPEVRVKIPGYDFELRAGIDYDIAYSDNVAVGNATVTVTGKGEYAGTASTQFEIIAKDINNGDHDAIGTDVIVDIGVAKPTGGAFTESDLPDMTVTYNGRTLEKNTDYTIDSTITVDGNTGTLTLLGKGNFTGTRQVSFAIGTNDITTAFDGIESISDITYTGSALEPPVVLTMGGVNAGLIQDTDYTVTYNNNIDAGQASVTITGIGSYGGSKTIDDAFTIKPADLDTNNEIEYQYENSIFYSPDVAGMKPEVTVNYKGSALEAGTDYNVSYDIESSPTPGIGRYDITISVASGNFTGTKTLSYEVKACPLSDQDHPDRIKLELTKGTVYTYTGHDIDPGLKLTHTESGTVLAESTDYTVDYSPNRRDAGTVTVTVTGKGNYTGFLQTTYTINKIPIETVKLEVDKAQSRYVAGYDGPYLGMLWYDGGNAVELEVTVKDQQGNLLQEGTDYEISYEDNKDMSKGTETAQLILTGKGDYTGTASYRFLIAKKLSDCDVQGVEDVTYTGDEITFENLEVSDPNGILTPKTVLEQGVDYDAVYENNVNAAEEGDASAPMVTIQAKEWTAFPTANGCYVSDGTDVQHTFTIAPRSLDEAELAGDIEKVYENVAVTLDYADINLVYNGKTLTDSDYTIGSYNNNDKVTDSATVLLRGKGNFNGTKTLAFRITGKTLDDAVVEVADAVYTGSALYPEVTVYTDESKTVALKKGTDYDYSNADYSNNVDAGEASVTITGLGTYAGSTRDVTFIIRPRDISTDSADGGTVSVQNITAPVTFTGSEIEQPNLRVDFTRNGTTGSVTLQKGSDYTVSYEDNVNVGTAEVIIEGTGNYTGEYTGTTFKIEQKDISNDDVEVAEIEPQGFTGIGVTPVPEITYGDYTLTSADYTLSYQNNISIGEATVTITGRGNFTGSTTANFQIALSIEDESQITVSCPDAGNTFIYKGSAYEPEVTVTRVGIGTLVEDEAYTVTYENNTDAGTASVTVKGIGNYAGTKTFQFTIAPKNISETDVTLAVGGKTDGSYSAVYTGSRITPDVVVAFGSIELKEKTDYTLTYGSVDVNNINAGTVPVTVTGAGNYTGTRSSNFIISPRSIGSGTAFANGFSMEEIPPQPEQNGNQVTPIPQLRYGRDLLVNEQDYNLTYTNNTASGTANIFIHGQGNFTGTVQKTFEITTSIEGAVVDIPEVYFDAARYDKNTDTITPFTFDDGDIKVTLDGQEVPREQYDVSYEGNDKALGNMTLIITGKEGLAGTVRKSFAVKGKMENATVTVGNQVWTGEPLTPVPIVTYTLGDYTETLTEGVEYVVTRYTGNSGAAGTEASVTVTGMDYMEGTATGTFQILANGGQFDVAGVEASYKYRGTAIKPAVTVSMDNRSLTEGEDYEVIYGANTNAGTKGYVTVTGIGSYEDAIAKVVTFDIEPQNMADLKILDGNSEVFANREYTGSEIIPEVKLVYQSGSESYTMQESDYTVTAGTNVVSVGTADIVITPDGNNITGDARTVQFQIKAKDISEPASGTDTIDVSLSDYSYTYDGTEKKPSVTVKYKYGTTDSEVRTLEENVDYTLVYSDNVNKGTASVTVTGIGNYTGSRTAEYEIAPFDITNAPEISASLTNGNSYPYMGSKTGVTPEVSVTWNGTPLTAGTDYEVTYSNNTSVGSNAMAQITGKGNFSGTVTCSFSIVQHDIAAADIILEPIDNQSYTGEPITPEVKMTCGDYQLQANVDYRLVFSGDHTEIGEVSVTIEGIGGFSGSRQTSFRIASSIENAVVEGLKASYTYTGSRIEVESLGITAVKIGETVLTADDYTIVYKEGSDGTNVGEQILLLKGTGTYGGSKELSFEIEPKDISDEDIVMTGFAESMPYEEELKQDITLTWGEITLKEDEDYTVTISPSSQSNIYTMTVAGKGNYTGKIVRDFTVIRSGLDGAEIRNVSSTYTYTGEEIKPVPEVWLNGGVLTEDEDYTVSYAGNINAGTATLTVTGKGNYSGTQEVTYTILRKSLLNGVTFSDIPQQTYTGREIRPTLTVSDGGRTLAAGQDYTLMYSNNRNPGNNAAAVIVAGKGNYTATKQVKFSIKPGAVASLAVTGNSNSSITIGWSSDGLATGYEIYRAGSDGQFKRIARRSGSTVYTDTNLTSGETYTYKVRAYLVTGSDTFYGSWSPEVRQTI